MGRKGGSKILMLLGVVLAFLAFGIVFVMANSVTAAATEEPRKQVVVARLEIPERAKLTRDLLDVVEMPVSLIPPKAFLKLEDVTDKLFAKERIYSRLPITQDQTVAGLPPAVPAAVQPVLSSAPQVQTQLVDPAFALESGQTVVSVEYPEAAKLITAGILKPGDRVNIFIKVPGPGGDQVAQVFPSTSFQNTPKPLEIKAIGNLTPSSAEAGAASPTMIFQVSPREAIVLKLLETMNPFFLIHPAVDKDNPTIRADVLSSEQVQLAVGLRPVGAQ